MCKAAKQKICDNILKDAILPRKHPLGDISSCYEKTYKPTSIPILMVSSKTIPDDLDLNLEGFQRHNLFQQVYRELSQPEVQALSEAIDYKIANDWGYFSNKIVGSE